jgi:hypothetical protein
VYLLLTAVLAAAIGIAWAALTDAARMPWPAVIGLALVAAAIATLTERGIHHLRLRRSRPHRRLHARPNPTNPKKAA